MSITKENSFIVISTSKGAVKVDCRDFSYVSYTGRTVKRLPKVVLDEYNLNNWRNNTEYRILKRIHDLGKSGERVYAIDILKVYEKFLSGNNLDLIDGLGDYDIAREIPKGFLQWCRDNGCKADADALNKYTTIQYIKKLNDLDKKFYEYLSQKRVNLNVIRRLNLVGVFRQIFNTTRKSGDIWCVYDDVRALTDKLVRVEKTFTEDEIKSALDTNRDFKHNVDILENYINRERNNKILENENKYREIETLSNDDYTIIVPRNMDDFTKEGKMQNNCVGYYYHDSIADGENFVYFIRKTEKPEKSYITCRYAFYAKETREYRTVNNNGVGDEKAIELIHTIDKMIEQIMSR
jgi:hypothetical protein